MRILVVSPHRATRDRPSAAIFVDRQVAALRALGHDVHLCSVNGSTPNRLAAAAAFALLIARTWRACVRGHFDLCILHYLAWPLLLAGRGVALRGAVPVVIVAHGYDVEAIEASERIRLLVSRLLRPGLKVAPVSQDLAGRIAATLACDQLGVIPMGVDRGLFTCGDDVDTADRNAYEVLFVGTINENKNIIALAEAVSLMVADGISVRLVVAGSGHLEERLSGYDCVKLIGEVSPQHVPELMRAADVVAMPSSAEGFGLVAVEAMACGTPVVVSRIPAAAYVPPTAGCVIDETTATGIRDGLVSALYLARCDPAGQEAADRLSTVAMAEELVQRAVLAHPCSTADLG